MKNLNKFVSIVAITLGLASCTPPIIPVPANPQAFFDANGVPIQTKIVTLGSGVIKVSFTKGTTLTFNNDSVVNLDGSVFTGNAVLQVREIASKADALLSNVLTVSGEQQLVSGGMFFLDLKKEADGAPLNVNPAKGVAAAVPLKANAAGTPAMEDRMQQFIADPTPLAAGDSSVNWKPVAGQFGIDKTTLPGSYVFSIFNKGWVNCDFFYSDSRPKTTLGVTFDAINDANTIVFMLPQNINSVISLYTKDGANKRKSYINSVPVGLNTEIIAITFNGGKQYLARKTITVTANLTENLTFVETSTADIKAYLETLN